MLKFRRYVLIKLPKCNYFFNLHTNYDFLTAPPREPYPGVNGCNTNTSSAMGDQGCVIQSMPPVNITCSVIGYYPNITLYFRKNSEILDNVNSAEWNNTDGTRNKAVTITAVSSDVLYTCVTSDIPGLDGQQRETTVALAAAEESTTEHTSTESATENVTNRARLISKLFPSFVCGSLNIYFNICRIIHVISPIFFIFCSLLFSYSFALICPKKQKAN